MNTYIKYREFRLCFRAELEFSACTTSDILTSTRRATYNIYFRISIQNKASDLFDNC